MRFPDPVSRHLLAAALVSTGLLLALATGAGAGTIQGRVDVKRELLPLDPRPTVSELGMPPPRGTPDRRRSVVYLEPGPRGAFEESERRRATLDQRSEAFVPYVLAITVGTNVDFPNHDRTYHNVFSLSKARRFDLGRYPQGESKSLRFDRPGVVRVFCDIHSHMSAFILVFAHRFFATTDAEGRYRLDDVPAGAYNLVAWNDGQVRDSRPALVPEGDGVVEQDFVLK